MRNSSLVNRGAAVGVGVSLLGLLVFAVFLYTLAPGVPGLYEVLLQLIGAAVVVGFGAGVGAGVGAVLSKLSA